MDGHIRHDDRPIYDQYHRNNSYRTVQQWVNDHHNQRPGCGEVFWGSTNKRTPPCQGRPGQICVGMDRRLYYWYPSTGRWRLVRQDTQPHDLATHFVIERPAQGPPAPRAWQRPPLPPTTQETQTTSMASAFAAVPATHATQATFLENAFLRAFKDEQEVTSQMVRAIQSMLEEMRQLQTNGLLSSSASASQAQVMLDTATRLRDLTGAMRGLTDECTKVMKRLQERVGPGEHTHRQAPEEQAHLTTMMGKLGALKSDLQVLQTHVGQQLQEMKQVMKQHMDTMRSEQAKLQLSLDANFQKNVQAQEAQGSALQGLEKSVAALALNSQALTESFTEAQRRSDASLRGLSESVQQHQVALQKIHPDMQRLAQLAQQLSQSHAQGAVSSDHTSRQMETLLQSITDLGRSVQTLSGQTQQTCQQMSRPVLDAITSLQATLRQMATNMQLQADRVSAPTDTLMESSASIQEVLDTLHTLQQTVTSTIDKKMTDSMEDGVSSAALMEAMQKLARETQTQREHQEQQITQLVQERAQLMELLRSLKQPLEHVPTLQGLLTQNAQGILWLQTQLGQQQSASSPKAASTAPPVKDPGGNVSATGAHGSSANASSSKRSDESSQTLETAKEGEDTVDQMLVEVSQRLDEAGANMDKIDQNTQALDVKEPDQKKQRLLESTAEVFQMNTSSSLGSLSLTGPSVTALPTTVLREVPNETAKGGFTTVKYDRDQNVAILTDRDGVYTRPLNDALQLSEEARRVEAKAYQAQFGVAAQAGHYDTLAKAFEHDSSCQKRFCTKVSLLETGSKPELHITPIGEPLTTWKKSRLDPSNQGTTFTLCQQLIDAIKCLHGKGYAHGDVSPDNIIIDMIDGQPNLRLIDLQAMDSCDERDMPLSTPKYGISKEYRVALHLRDKFGVVTIINEWFQEMQPTQTTATSSHSMELQTREKLKSIYDSMKTQLDSHFAKYNNLDAEQQSAHYDDYHAVVTKCIEESYENMSAIFDAHEKPTK